VKKKARWATKFISCWIILRARKTKAMQTFQPESPKLRFRFTPELFFLAQSGGVMVCQNPARRERPRRVHVRGRSCMTKIHSYVGQITVNGAQPCSSKCLKRGLELGCRKLALKTSGVSLHYTTLPSQRKHL